MYCSSCGIEFPDSFRFCSQCGAGTGVARILDATGKPARFSAGQGMSESWLVFAPGLHDTSASTSR